MSENMALEMLNEQFEEGFKIDNDSSAEWALRKIAADRAEAQRLINVCDSMILQYGEKKQKYAEQCECKTAYLVSLLNQYFGAVEHKKTETRETYSLPSGKLVLKYPKTKFEIDDIKLVKWLKENNLKDYYETKEIPKWGEFKKVVSVSGEKIVTADGEVVDGVTAQEMPPVFEVEV